jgi:integrase
MLLGWLEKFVCGQGLRPGRDACALFWKEAVLTRTRESWQLEQWGAAIRWYLRWLENQRATGGEVRSLRERVRDAVNRAGARRGLAPRTRETYGRWAAAFAGWVGNDRAMLRPEKGRDFLAWQVIDTNATTHAFRHSFATLIRYGYTGTSGYVETQCCR